MRTGRLYTGVFFRMFFQVWLELGTIQLLFLIVMFLSNPFIVEDGLLK